MSDTPRVESAELFVVFDREGPSFSTTERHVALDHAKECDPDYMTEYGPITVERYVHERELAASSTALAAAAREINVAGPVDHRIRILKQEYADKLRKIEATLKEKLGIDDYHPDLDYTPSSEIKRLQAKIDEMRKDLRLFSDAHTSAQARLKEVEADAERLDAVAENYWRLAPFDMPTGSGDANVGWEIVKYQQGPVPEFIVAQEFSDDPRKAIDAAREGK